MAWLIALAVLVALVALVAFVSYHARRAGAKLGAQAAIYALAARRAARTGKPLAVVGDPCAPRTLNAWFGPGYGCGDLCVDLAGSPHCRARGKAVWAGAVLPWLRAQPDDSWVIFESETLMFVPRAELDGTIAELYRVGGGDVFASHSNVIDITSYVRTGRPQAPSRFQLWRAGLARYPRVFTEFPPFGGYAWIELAGAKGPRPLRRARAAGPRRSRAAAAARAGGAASAPPRAAA